MTERELRTVIRKRFTALRAEVHRRRAELIAETEARLFERYQAESERVDELNRGLKEITDEANRKAIALLRQFENLAEGGRWSGARQAMFEVPRLRRARLEETRLYRARIAEIDRQTRQTLRVLGRQQATLLRAPDRAQTWMARAIPAIIISFIPPTRLQEIDAQLDAAAIR